MVKVFSLSATSWESFGILDESHQFFVQCWFELFAETTPDTWQVRTCNAATILTEIVETIDVARDHHKKFGHNLPSLIDELKSVVKRDPVIAQYVPLVSKEIAELCASDHESRLSEIRRKALILAGRLKGYTGWLIKETLKAVKECDPKEKEGLSRLLLALATALSAKGYSTPYLRRRIDDLLDVNEPSFINRVKTMFRAMRGESREFTCVIPVTWTGPEPKTEPIAENILLIKGLPEEIKHESEETFYRTLSPQDVFAKIAVSALDVVSARLAAERRLSELLATIRFFQLSKYSQVKGYDVLIYDGDAIQIVGRDESRRRYLADTKDLEGKIGQASRIIARACVDKERLIASLQYHRLALEAPNDESRLVNLWVALECIARIRETSIIDDLASTVSRSIASNNITKYVTNMAIYVSKTWNDPKEYLAHYPKSTKHRLRREDLLDTLLDIEDGPKINALYSTLGCGHLTRYRLFRLRKKLFNNPNNVAAALEAHQQNVDWQVRRIYRARNQVMHRGHTSSLLRHLTQHLHSYFVTILNNVIYDLSRNDGWGIGEALEARSMLFDRFINCLRSNTAHELTTNVLTDASALYEKMEGRVIWPSSKGKDESKAAVTPVAPIEPAPTDSSP